MLEKINDLLTRQKENNKVFIHYKDETITFKQLYDCTKDALRNINDIGNNVGIFIPNSIDYAKAYFSIMDMNCTVCPIAVSAKEDEILSTTLYCEYNLMITCNKYIDYIMDIYKKHNYRIQVLNIDTSELFVINQDQEFICKQKDKVNDVAVMLHTSGTTSSPKRVMLTHYNILTNIESNIENLNFCENDVALICLPMFFGYCNTAQFLTHLYVGGSLVILSGIFSARTFFSLVENHKITNFTAVPTMMEMIATYRHIHEHNYSSLRIICFGGGYLATETLKKLIDELKNVGIVQTYGQTEAGPRATSLLPEDSRRKMGSIGKPIPRVEVDVVDENSKSLPPNEIGEIIIRSQSIMKGYFKRPEETNRVKINGWLHSGDLGYKDDEGFFYLKGRIKNMIITGGINVYPEEIEETIMGTGYVQDVRVYGSEDKLLGEIVNADLVLRDEFSDKLEEIKKTCKTRLADYKVPKEYKIVDSIQKTVTGKIKRRF